MRADDLVQRRDEVAGKLEQLRRLLWRRGLDAIHLTTIANTAWLTAGASTYVDESTDAAACSLLVTRDAARVLTDPIEEPRLRAEERLNELGLTLVVEPWYARGHALRLLTAGLRLGGDTASAHGRTGVDVSADLVALRSVLTEGEQARMREGARRAAATMWEATHALSPQMPEHVAAALLAAGSRRRGGAATVTLVASDERIAQFRHPLPTDKLIERHAMLVLCFRYQGLITALTRTVYFGEAPDALTQLTAAVARVDAQVIAATRPGRTLGDMYNVLSQAYAREGQSEAIEQHHQGGTIAYRGRETFARPGLLTRIELGQAFAWNPSLRGAKSEDTMLLTASGPEILTAVDDWPMLAVETEGGMMARPGILQISPT
ncbi:MAG TPA: M24 family metallopeptidase [Ktedonobacterales bacterium]|jgi:antitoxin VapB|nr:M24 family metallopeptidase [Ktedonobacterales bacterium]